METVLNSLRKENKFFFFLNTNTTSSPFSIENSRETDSLIARN